MGNCCCQREINNEDAFMKGRTFVPDNKIFTIRKYGNNDKTTLPSDPYVIGGQGKFVSFKEPGPDKNSNIKRTKKRSTKKIKEKSEENNAKSDNSENKSEICGKEYVRTTSMVEFCNDMSGFQPED